MSRYTVRLTNVRSSLSWWKQSFERERSMRPSRCFGDSPFVRGVNTAHDALIASLFSTMELSVPSFWNVPPPPPSFFRSLFFWRGKLRKIKGVWRYWRFHSPLSSGSTRQRVKLPFVANFRRATNVGRGLKGNLI